MSGAIPPLPLYVFKAITGATCLGKLVFTKCKGKENFRVLSVLFAAPCVLISR